MNQVFSVSEFINFTNTAFKEAVFPYGAAVEGEVVEYKISQGKWIWFKLKDEDSVIDCFGTTWQLKAVVEDGMKIRATGTPKIFPKSGKFSLNVYNIELIGEGALRRAFELLKKKLEIEGIFSQARKRLIPEFPETIGLITSNEAAAYTDFLRIAGNRCGGVQVNFYHVQVQGRDALRDIGAAFEFFNTHPELAEVLVLTRGGGSMEDLQAFNSEEVARAIFGSRIPVIVGVGHERDETLADFVADLRASTPTNAAELIFKDRADVQNELTSFSRRMETVVFETLSYYNIQLLETERVLERRINFELEKFRLFFSKFQAGLNYFLKDLQNKHLNLNRIFNSIESKFGRTIKNNEKSLIDTVRILKNLDPRRLLERGYSIVCLNGKIITNAEPIDIGARLDVQLHRGQLITKVQEKI